MLKWITGRKRKEQKAPPYDKAREIAEKGGIEERRDQASNEDLHPEILYYFATDESPEVRRRVAENPGTPLQADKVLARDVDDEVRCELAAKIGRLVPSLSKDENERLTNLAIEVLEILARDNLPRVRSIVSQEIKQATNIPHHLVRRLAEDVEEIVSAPVLEYSPLLSGQDLLEIIAGGVSEGALTAVANRRDLAESVVDALVDIHKAGALKALLGNKSAHISEEILDKIAIIATGAVELHEPIINRENLSLRMIRRIAGFVSASLVDILIERNELNDDVASDIRRAVRKRISKDDFDEDSPDPDTGGERARQMFEQGSLDEEAVIDAIDENDKTFVRQALVLLSGLPEQAVSKMLDAGSGKAVTALAWKSGLSMWAATKLQTRIARIQPKSMIKAREGRNYPMPEADLNWYVDYFAD